MQFVVRVCISSVFMDFSSEQRLLMGRRDGTTQHPRAGDALKNNAHRMTACLDSTVQYSTVQYRVGLCRERTLRTSMLDAFFSMRLSVLSEASSDATCFSSMFLRYRAILRIVCDSS